ncbi:alpha-ketoglutarate-dependent dioxygenase AlkB [Paraburkholderia sp. DHOC27]|uniref:alpha-ketoglutarate-dependent dioxygenase AlkB family protein n=1 Tax=Paraburkholderia sp. DHOC27 TaxID=2303330 RepID=UPI000E3CE5D8|nr:alpha-ketoglutarate-dependent dioxygenase AlkB [Paraburkholderia sp. DHOC27]RFU49188.1 alpha-ketoglutarate-dependent dioxygenase AlkB [Paraburkholderia sp. DHOC27]
MVFQQELFEPTPTQVTQDDDGGICYLPACLGAAHAQQWFDVLLKDAGWGAYRRKMYDREVAVPRLITGYADDAPSLPEPLAEAFALVRERVNAPFNHVGLNLYRDEKDSVALHGDKVDKLVQGEPIAILSLGETRRMSIRARHEPVRVRHIDLEAGSVLIMSYESQLTHEHGIPKLTRPCGPRISLAFRCVANPTARTPN